MFQMLMALSKIEEPERQKSRECAERALEAAVEHKLIEANPQVWIMFSLYVASYMLCTRAINKHRSSTKSMLKISFD